MRPGNLGARLVRVMGWGLGCAITAWTGTVCSATAPVALTVRQYALTSANDFPQRDPQDWRLLGSTNGGRNWTTLDRRKQEVFPERHQRRVFKIQQPGAYTVYRLQIDRVRDPAAADSVQLAEIEPLGETETNLEPAPLPEDLITAQSENSPLETRWQAFDGRVETKWLDHAVQNPATRSSWIQWQYVSHSDLVITNLGRLLALGNRASHRYRVRIEGVVAVAPGFTNTLPFLDRTGALNLSPGDASEAWVPGRRVLLEGNTEWTPAGVGVTAVALKGRGSPPPTAPARIGLDDRLTMPADLEWVEVEGTAGFFARTGDHLTFDLQDGGHRLAVRVLRPEQGIPRQFAGARVVVRGFCEPALNSQGEPVPGTLLVLDCRAITPVASAPPPKPSANAVLPQSPPVAAAPVLTNIEQIRRLGPEQLVRWPRVQVRGVVTELFGGYIQEDDAGVEVWLGTNAPDQTPGLGDCIAVEGRGDWAIGHGPIIRVDSLRNLGRGKLPPAERCSWSQLASGRMVDQWVEVEGVLQATDGSHLLLSCEGGQMMATIRSAPAPAVKRLVDATVRLRGVCVPASDSHGRMQGVQVLVPSLEYVEIEEPAVEPFSQPRKLIGSLLQVRGPNEFIHRVKIEGVMTCRDGRHFFLQDATGGAMAIAQEEVVLTAPGGGWNWMFRQSPKPETAAAERTNFNVGDRLQVVGFPEMRGYSPVLTEVVMRKVGRTNNVPAAQASPQDLATGGMDCMLVTLEGVLLRQQTQGTHVVLEIQSGDRIVQALLPAREKGLAAIAPDSRVRVTGVCQIEPGPYPELGRTIGAFKLVVQSAADVSVLSRPPWWTLKRVVLVTAAMAVVLALAGAWIAILRRQVEEHTRLLQQEISEHEKTEARLAAETNRVQAEIEERKRIEAEVEKSHKQLLTTSRLAGMAEVATSVLHNVGNVLNSANILASHVVHQVQQSKITSVGRLAELLRQHRHDLARFLGEDSQGKQLPGYVQRLGDHLVGEQNRLLDKVKALLESIQHIKQIVATQQDYAKVAGVLETVALAEIADDALRIHSGALTRHQVKLVRDYAPAPPVTLDRQKVLQILFNLLENAKYACETRDPAERQITVRIYPQDRCVCVRVIDNGIGIPRENLGRIFAQEFSTRQGGHGFGLHSSMMAAQDLGASLSVASDGPGQGATFTLALPLAAETEPAPGFVAERAETIRGV